MSDELDATDRNRAADPFNLLAALKELIAKAEAHGQHADLDKLKSFVVALQLSARPTSGNDIP